MIEEVRLPEISENVDSGDVISVLVKPGDFIKAEQPIAELETEKATFDVPSPISGKVIEVNLKPGQKVKTGQVIIKVDTAAPPEMKKTAPPTQPQPQEHQEIIRKPENKQAPEETTPSVSGAIPVAPSVRHLAGELGVDIEKVRGTGPDGRISAEDIKQYVKQLISGGAASREEVVAMPLPDFSKWGTIERQPMTVTRKKIADTLTYAWHTIPHVTQYSQADITMLEEFRKEYAPKAEHAGGKLTITAILLKVVGEALKHFPKFNASLDPVAGEIIYKKYYHINVAVETERGLLVPVVRDVDKKTILQLAVELTELSEKTRTGQVSPDEMVGGNFTISNLGGIGGTNFAPIIYWPQVAILGVARAAQKPLYFNGQLQPRLIVPLSLSYDHRLIDGAEAVRFLTWIVDALEKPFLLEMEK